MTELPAGIKLTSGGTFDRDAVMVYFVASSPETVERSNHSNVLVAVNEVRSPKDVAVLDRLCDTRKVLLDSGIFNLAMGYAAAHDQLIAAALEVNADLQRRGIDLSTPQPKEHTAMNTEHDLPDLGELDDVEAGYLATRPTKHVVTELLQQLRTARVGQDDAQASWRTARARVAELEDDRDRWRTAHLPDPEAEALAGCVRAIEALVNPPNQRGNVGGYATAGYAYGPGDRPQALGMPTGRILLALAARYGVPLQAIPPPEQTGPVLVSVPPEYAQAFAGLAEQGWPR